MRWEKESTRKMISSIPGASRLEVKVCDILSCTSSPPPLLPPLLVLLTKEARKEDDKILKKGGMGMRRMSDEQVKSEERVERGQGRRCTSQN